MDDMTDREKIDLLLYTLKQVLYDRGTRAPEIQYHIDTEARKTIREMEELNDKQDS